MSKSGLAWEWGICEQLVQMAVSVLSSYIYKGPVCISTDDTVAVESLRYCGSTGMIVGSVTGPIPITFLDDI
eukprot:1318321-Ditylum_brightwellii.AAC.1